MEQSETAVESLDEFMTEARQGSIPDSYEGEEQAYYDFLRSLPR